MCFLRNLLSCGELRSTIFAVCIPSITFFCTGCFFYISYFCVLMFSCCRDFFCFRTLAGCTGVSSDSCLYTTCFLSYLSGIPGMFFLRYFLSCGKLRSTVFAVRISGVTFFCTSCFFCISYFWVLMFSCCRDFFCFCSLTGCTGVGSDSCFCAGCFLSYPSRIPGMFYISNYFSLTNIS